MTTPSWDEPCRRLDWDTAWWGVRTAEVVGPVKGDREIRALDEWCLRNRVRLLYFLCPSTEPAAAQLAEAAGFRLMDVRIGLQNDSIAHPTRRDRQDPTGVSIRMVKANDVDVLGRLASRSYRFTRFYADAGLPDGRCDDLYRTWIEQDCRGKADAVLVADIGGEIAGYISCAVDRSRSRGAIGLVGVSDAHQGQGIGSFLVEASLRWFEGEGATTAYVVTQGRNVAALRVYERHGFVAHDTGFWFHKWYPASPDP